MLEFAGTPVLMGNALAELKARGWPVTATNDEAGVARAIETFISGRRHRLSRLRAIRVLRRHCGR